MAKNSMVKKLERRAGGLTKIPARAATPTVVANAASVTPKNECPLDCIDDMGSFVLTIALVTKLPEPL